ncbi:MAG: hypothetical protein PHR21_03155 [Oscillospiraceae bacterium]|nr:hypothetical protein [Oscillospiraceae bacterium]
MPEQDAIPADSARILPPPLKGRGERWDQYHRRVLIYQCRECGFTVEHVQLPADYICPFCEADRQQFHSIDPTDFPTEYINERWSE